MGHSLTQLFYSSEYTSRTIRFPLSRLGPLLPPVTRFLRQAWGRHLRLIHLHLHQAFDRRPGRWNNECIYTLQPPLQWNCHHPPLNTAGHLKTNHTADCGTMEIMNTLSFHQLFTFWDIFEERENGDSKMSDNIIESLQACFSWFDKNHWFIKKLKDRCYK